MLVLLHLRILLKCSFCFSSSGEGPQVRLRQLSLGPRVGQWGFWQIHLHPALWCSLLCAAPVQGSQDSLILSLNPAGDSGQAGSASVDGDCWPHHWTSQRRQHTVPGKMRAERARVLLGAHAPRAYHTPSLPLLGEPFPSWISPSKHKRSPPGQSLSLPEVIGLSEVRAGQLHSLRAPALPLPPASDRAHFISSFTGCIYCQPLGSWCLPCQCEGFMWILGPNTL